MVLIVTLRRAGLLPWCALFLALHALDMSATAIVLAHPAIGGRELNPLPALAFASWGTLPTLALTCLVAALVLLNTAVIAEAHPRAARWQLQGFCVFKLLVCAISVSSAVHLLVS